MSENGLGEKLFSSSMWDKVGRSALYLLGFFLPVFVLPFGANPLTTNKVALSYFLIIISFACWFISSINKGKVSLPKNYLALAFVLLVLSWFVSGLFSASPHFSFSGLSSDPSSFFAVLMFALTGFTAYFYLRSPEKIFLWLSAVSLSAFLVFIIQILRLSFNFNILFWINFASPIANVFGSWTELGIFFSVVGVLSVFIFEFFVGLKTRMFFLLLSFVSLAVLVLVNNVLIWWVTFAFLLVILAYLLSLKQKRLHIFRATFFAMLIVLLFIQVPAISETLVSYFGVENVEVRPSWMSSWVVVKDVIGESPFFGSGPSTFVYDWLRFKPLEVNESIFWNVRFSSGASFAISLIASSGIVGFAVFLFIIFSFLYYGIKSLANSVQTRLGSVFIPVFIGTLMISAYSFFHNPGFVMMLFLFVFFGMFMAIISKDGIVGEYDISLFRNSGVGFISALFIIFMIIVFFSGFYFLGQKYASAYFFGRAAELGASGDLEEAASSLRRATDFDKRDVYFRAASELNLRQISELISRGDLPEEDVRSSFRDILSSAIQNAKTATDLNPIDPLNWIALGRVYESVIPLQIAGASDFASSAYVTASENYPTSPEPLLASARVALSQNNLDKAKDLLENSLKLKSNYTSAHFLLAQIEDALGNIDAAISRAENAVILSPGEVGTLFQLGLLYYRSDRLEDAKIVFERAVAINNNYSNARYFLGLIYSRLGESRQAIEQFEFIQKLNPQNQEVVQVLENLREDKRALEDITPAPEERGEPPLSE